MASLHEDDSFPLSDDDLLSDERTLSLLDAAESRFLRQGKRRRVDSPAGTPHNDVHDNTHIVHRADTTSPTMPMKDEPGCLPIKREHDSDQQPSGSSSIALNGVDATSTAPDFISIENIPDPLPPTRHWPPTEVFSNAALRIAEFRQPAIPTRTAGPRHIACGWYAYEYRLENLNKTDLSRLFMPAITPYATIRDRGMASKATTPFLRSRWLINWSQAQSEISSDFIDSLKINNPRHSFHHSPGRAQVVLAFNDQQLIWMHANIVKPKKSAAQPTQHPQRPEIWQRTSHDGVLGQDVLVRHCLFMDFTKGTMFTRPPAGQLMIVVFS